MIEKLIPAIKWKWSAENIDSPILIQQDNVKTYINVNDVEFYQVAKQYGFNIHLMCQPPNSPDMNVLDLGFF
ncbi:hypothetical protein Syun_025803 [Stephania yunnanensis]|uniref:Transposase n=1 Tax=Stephania yunnanensis TaxID=152371 RepID=A0AAP0HRL6_9MAGN